MTGDARSRTVRDASSITWEIGTVVAPASWVTELINDDPSGLEQEPADAEACRTWLTAQHVDGWRVIDLARDAEGSPEESSFSWAADLHGPPWRSADLLTYLRERRVASAGGEGEG